MNIVLTGFMGTGKTSVGKIIASELGMSFIDMDHVIEERENREISNIFASDGEPYFRQLEFNLAKELSQQSNLVVATGGGVVLNPDNIINFESSGIVFCLMANPHTIMERVAKETHRPLLEGDEKMQKILGILESRKELYNSIKNKIDTTNMTVQEVADNIIDVFRNIDLPLQ